MKISLGTMTFELDKGAEFEFDLHDGVTPRHGFIRYESASPVIVRREPPRTRALATLAIEYDPDAPKRTRRFITLALGQGIDFPGELQFFTVFQNPQNGSVLAVYEVVAVDAVTRAPAATLAIETPVA
jgi:hypothetical protein